MAASRWGSLATVAVALAAASPALAKDTNRDDIRVFERAVPRAPNPVIVAAQRDDRRDDDRWYRDDDRRDDRWYRDDDRRDDRYRNDRREARSFGFNNGRADGYEKGLNDGRDRHNFDPTRHKWYRNADRNYERSYGSRAQYENSYRDGFRRGYEDGYRDGDRNTQRRTGGFPFPRTY